MRVIDIWRHRPRVILGPGLQVQAIRVTKLTQWCCPNVIFFALLTSRYLLLLAHPQPEYPDSFFAWVYHRFAWLQFRCPIVDRKNFAHANRFCGDNCWIIGFFSCPGISISTICDGGHVSLTCRLLKKWPLTFKDLPYPFILTNTQYFANTLLAFGPVYVLSIILTQLISKFQWSKRLEILRRALMHETRFCDCH